MSPRVAPLVLTIAAIACCSAPQAVDVQRPSGPSPVNSLVYEERWLPRGGWYPGNHDALEGWLDSVSSRDFERPPVAVFDWDNTCIFNDVGEAVLRYQLDRLELKFTPETLAAFLLEEVNGQRTVDGDVALSDLRADLLDAYHELWPLIEAGDVDAARALPAHRDFRAKAAWLYEALADTEEIGVEYTLTWLVGWLAGFTENEVSSLVREVIEAARQEPVQRRTWSAVTPARAGLLEHTFTAGLCPHDEIRDLMEAMVRAEMDIFVVSASGELIVEAAASYFGFPLERGAIFGIRVVMSDGVVTTRTFPPSRYPVTYRQGKVDVILREIGRVPLFVAGDADTDFEMLTNFDETEVRLVINRNKQDAEIGQLYREALSPPASVRPLTLLQGRDEARCSFQPSQETSSSR